MIARPNYLLALADLRNIVKKAFLPTTPSKQGIFLAKSVRRHSETRLFRQDLIRVSLID